MESHVVTTPFGRRALSRGMLAGQAAAHRCEQDASANKWELVRAVGSAREKIGLTDRAVALLDVLVSFYPGNELAGEGNLVVFPSNEQIRARAHRMAPATLRRHLAVLVECGLVVRRDSPNGKRFARRGVDGEIEQAYGFDLAPLLARRVEFERLAAEIDAERRALKLARERITLLRRDIAKMIAFGIEEAIDADWEGVHLAYRDVVSRIPRTTTADALRPLGKDLEHIAAIARKALENGLKLENLNANESQSDLHYQNSNTHVSLELEPRSEKEPDGAAEPEPLEVKHTTKDNREKSSDTKPPAGYPLGLVLRACPDIADYARDGISGWADLIETANLVRGALGVSPDAWAQACEVMGKVDAAIVIAAILQRSDQISSAGGYLRALTDKARGGAFSVGPVLMALLRARGRQVESNAG